MLNALATVFNCRIMSIQMCKGYAVKIKTLAFRSGFLWVDDGARTRNHWSHSPGLYH